jgi:hypothetical protein
MGMGCKLMSTWMEVAVDEGMCGEEVLRLFGRFELLHLPLSSSRRTMRVITLLESASARVQCRAGE